ncbi:hypothetical protein jhhlp_005284 [Lomentospora prolificans]|uniref:Nudix hydrolase domain-containing protein n=1 Tax=Lomentospora prolificans TaxID=41688 RepID=A0A2N3N7B9_9PEZI|nr:hypothetical protein jhhlp_005284 [Lomentospora prolificans]
MSQARPKKPIPEPSPSASVVLVSPTNQVLLLHRVKTSTSFASAHVFPGGNVDAKHDGEVPPPENAAQRHADGPAYRVAALRECFEESGILLAKGKDGKLMNLSEAVRDDGRRKVHNGEIKFGDWLEGVGAVPDVDGLIPFTRWITPPPTPKRLLTQMYLCPELPPKALPQQAPRSPLIPINGPHFGGMEHTRPNSRPIRLDPPPPTTPSACSSSLLARFFPATRNRTPGIPPAREPPPNHPTSAIPWAEKIISPRVLKVREDGYVVLGLDKASAEVEGIRDGKVRGGLFDAVVVVNLKAKGGPWNLGVFGRDEALRGEIGPPASGKL